MTGRPRCVSPFAHLLPLLRDTAHVREMGEEDWDDTIRLARQARLLGLLAHRLAAQKSLWAAVPARVRGHLRASINYSNHRLQLVRSELAALETVLPRGMPVILLKGAAYIEQRRPFSHGRIPNDVDLLVRSEDIGRAESALVAAGWEFQVDDDYDQRYYREWSHELPPLRSPGHPLELDVHHTIAPVTGRTRPDNSILFRDAIALSDSRFQVLDLRDQIVHAAIHLFQDTELDNRLRDLVDIDGLLRDLHPVGDSGRQLQQRAEQHRASGWVWYALHYCNAWLATPIPVTLGQPPGKVERMATDCLMRRNFMPRVPDQAPGLTQRLARHGGRVRYHLLRMPPTLLARHLLYKARRRLSGRKRSDGVEP
jgi:hypothetical protein